MSLISFYPIINTLPTVQVNTLFNLKSNKSTYGTNNEKGTGLGLVLCKDLIEQNGGKISVTSQYGQGTMFTIVLRNSEATSILV